MVRPTIGDSGEAGETAGVAESRVMSRPARERDSACEGPSVVTRSRVQRGLWHVEQVRAGLAEEQAEVERPRVRPNEPLAVGRGATIRPRRQVAINEQVQASGLEA